MGTTPRRPRTSNRRKQMGRPVNKRNFGTVLDEVGAEASENITVNVKVGSNSISNLGIILSQRSVNKFKVDDANDGSGNEGICTLVDKDAGALGDNEMSLIGYVGGTGDGVNVKKLYNRTCRDFSNNRYTWSMSDDSTSNVMVLTAI